MSSGPHQTGFGPYRGSPLTGAAGPWQRRWAPGRWRRMGAVWGRTSCYRRSLLHPAQASGSVSPDAAAWRDRGPIQVTAHGTEEKQIQQEEKSRKEPERTRRRFRKDGFWSLLIQFSFHSACFHVCGIRNKSSRLLKDPLQVLNHGLFKSFRTLGFCWGSNPEVSVWWSAHGFINKFKLNRSWIHSSANEDL